MKILITKCRGCETFIKGEIVTDNTKSNSTFFHEHIFYAIDSEENKKGFSISRCKCKCDPSIKAIHSKN